MNKHLHPSVHDREHFDSAFLKFYLNVLLLTEVEYDDPSCEDEAKDFKFVKWLIKEKVRVLLMALKMAVLLFTLW